jgi:hypothetical protein
MKTKLILIAISAILAALLSIMVSLYSKEKKESQRQGNNYRIELKQKLDEQQEITKIELKKYYEEEIQILKEQRIKPEQIQNIIKIKYNFIDTTVVKDTLIYVYDTITNHLSAPFTVKNKCTVIKGKVDNNNVYVTETISTDSILISLYREKKNCLFERRKIKAIAISSCKNDTLTILRNLKIIK